MGNNIVIPSLGNWYLEPLKKMKIKVCGIIESSTFFLTLDCESRDGRKLIVKAYEYNSKLAKIDCVNLSLEYFEHLKSFHVNHPSVVGYDPIHVVDRFAFLVRPKFEFTLSQRLDDFPVLEDIEKLWICFQILYQMVEFQVKGFVHGDLHPENIFLDWSLRVHIGDQAPFKPAQVSPEKPHTFIHFFGSSSSTRCYLSPQRIVLKGESTMKFTDLTPADDLFSVGCIIYFLYSGKHLFTLYSLVDYINGGGVDVEKAVEVVPEQIRPLVLGLLSLRRQVRLDAFQSFRSCFSKIFHQLLFQTEEYFISGSTLGNICSMTPTFQLMMEDEPPEVLVIFSDLFSQYLLEAQDVHSQIQFSYFLVEFLANLSDELLLTRVLPTFVGLLENEYCVVKSTALECIGILLQHLEVVPDHLVNIFTNYVLVQIKTSAMDDSSYRVSLCRVVPVILNELFRLSPESVSPYLELFLFLSDPQGKGLVSYFVNGVVLAVRNVDIRVLETMSDFVQTLMASVDLADSLQLLNLMKHLYEKVQEAERRRCIRAMRKTVECFLSVNDVDFTSDVLEVMLWYILNKFISYDYLFVVFNGLCLQLNSLDPSVRFMVEKITNMLPHEFQDAVLPTFVMKRMNRSKSPFQNCSYPMGIFRDPSAVRMMKESTINLKPRFLSSSRCANSRILSGLEMDSTALFVCNDGGQVLKSSFDSCEYQLVTTLKYPAHSMLREASNLCFVGSTGSLAIMDFEKITCVKSVDVEQQLRAIHVQSDNSMIVCLEGTSDIVFRDSRNLEVIEKCHFSGVNIAAISSWEDSQTLALGCGEGLVFLYDARIFRPFSELQTVSALSVAPIAGRSESLLVANPCEFAIYDVAANTKIAGCSAPVEAVLSKDGEGIIALPDSVIVPNMKEQQYYRLYSDGPMEIHPLDGTLAFGAPQHPPLHRHSERISFIAETHDGVMSGDVIGNVNCWCIA